MPELPEVETTIRGIKPHLQLSTISNVIIRQPKLRWPIPSDFTQLVSGQCIKNIRRRAKYIIFELESGNIIMHLGMSGRVRIIEEDLSPEKHDHVDIAVNNGKILRYTDPRRFGSILWHKDEPQSHPLLSKLGPEPLSQDFNATHLYQLAQKRRAPIKTFIMDHHVVVGVGNIYATEALFNCKIHPLAPANTITIEQFHQLVHEIQAILRTAIQAGGTTLRDFLGSDGKPGYFVQKLQAYGRAGKECVICENILETLRIGQRSSAFCPTCQPLD